MKKKWVEVRDGMTIEVSSVRSVSVGDSNYLHIKYVGERTTSSINMKTEEATKKGYKRVKEALAELSKESK